jgi:hypothetical protein
MCAVSISSIVDAPNTSDVIKNFTDTVRQIFTWTHKALKGGYSASIGGMNVLMQRLTTGNAIVGRSRKTRANLKKVADVGMSRQETFSGL